MEEIIQVKYGKTCFPMNGKIHPLLYINKIGLLLFKNQYLLEVYSVLELEVNSGRVK